MASRDAVLRGLPPIGGAALSFWEVKLKETGVRNAAYGADKFGFKKLSGVNWNLTEAPLYEHAVANNEASIVAGGALSAFTSQHTGRSPKDKHTVIDDLTKKTKKKNRNHKQTKEHNEEQHGDFIK